MSAAGSLPSANPAPPETEEVSWPAYLGLIGAAGVLGVLTACGAWLFNQVLNFTHDVAFNTLGGLLQPLGSWTIALIPMLGGIVVAVILRLLARPDALTGMAHIIERVARSNGRLDTRNGVAFVLGSAVGIGVGIPVGVDTPKAMIGAHLASFLGRRLGLRTSFIGALVVAGAGAGISATYMAQLAGIFFALEIVLGGVGGWLYLGPCLAAVATATITGVQIYGIDTLFGNAAAGVANIRFDWTLLLYVGVAVLAALAAIAFVNLLPLTRRLWQQVRLSWWLRTALAGLLVGIVGIWFPAIFTSSLTVMKQVFSGTVFSIGTLVSLCLLTLILTPQSLGGGFVGGVIGPALVIGSTLGAAYGAVVVHLLPGAGLSPVTFAMVATTAMLAGTLHAPLFALAMIYEMAGNATLLVPLFMASAIGYLLARRFQSGSAYTYMFPGMGLSIHYRTSHVSILGRSEP